MADYTRSATPTMAMPQILCDQPWWRPQLVCGTVGLEKNHHIQQSSVHHSRRPRRWGTSSMMFDNLAWGATMCCCNVLAMLQCFASAVTVSRCCYYCMNMLLYVKVVVHEGVAWWRWWCMDDQERGEEGGGAWRKRLTDFRRISGVGCRSGRVKVGGYKWRGLGNKGKITVLHIYIWLF